MRISDWSSDVCSSDLDLHVLGQAGQVERDVGVDELHALGAPIADHAGRVGDAGNGGEAPVRLAVDDGYAGLPGALAARVLVRGDVLGPARIAVEERTVRFLAHGRHFDRPRGRVLRRAPGPAVADASRLDRK